jgi:hypothetical protein
MIAYPSLDLIRSFVGERRLQVQSESFAFFVKQLQSTQQRFIKRHLTRSFDSLPKLLVRGTAFMAHDDAPSRKYKKWRW